MKFTVTFHDPDGFHESVREEAGRMLPREGLAGLNDAEYEDAVEAREQTLRGIAARWVDFGEYVTIEFDVEAGTARVLALGE